MSTVCLIASDTPLPFTDMRTLKAVASEYGTVTFLQGFAVGNETDFDVDDSIMEKEYVYDFSIEADDACLEQLKLYIAYNVEIGREVEIWSVRLGGDTSKHYTHKILIRHMEAGETHAPSDINDEIDWYKENFVEPKRVSSVLEKLSVDDIRFVLENTSVCLTVKK